MTGVVLHMLPEMVGVVEARGKLSRRLTFQASLVPMFWTSRPKVAGCPGIIVVGPDFVSTRFGPDASTVKQNAEFAPIISTAMPKTNNTLFIGCAPLNCRYAR